MERKILERSCAVNKPFSQIAQEMNRSETWLFDVFWCETDCTDKELDELAVILKVKPKYLSGLLKKKNTKKESYLSKAAWLIFDKVVIGLVVLLVALTVQWQYENFSLKREKALSVSNLKSDYVTGNYSKLQSSFITILAISDGLIASLSLGENKGEEHLEKVAQIIKLETEIQLYVELLKTNDDLQASGSILLNSITLFTKRLKSLSPDSETSRTRKSLEKEFSTFSFEVQKLLIAVSNNEVDNIIKGRLLNVEL
jgi:hypothetical protein